MKTKANKWMARQGDVLVVFTDAAPEGDAEMRERGRVVLAHGEVTGHAHAISNRQATLLAGAVTEAALLKARSPRARGRILVLKQGSDLRHEEHDTVKIPRGTYEVIRQREYRYGVARRVED